MKKDGKRKKKDNKERSSGEGGRRPPQIAKPNDKALKKVLKISTKLQASGLTIPARMVLQARLDKLLEKSGKKMTRQGAPLPAPARPDGLRNPYADGAMRAPRPGHQGIIGKEAVSPDGNPFEAARREERRARFDETSAPSLQPAATLREARAAGREEVFGQSQALEKEYLRLTSLPRLDAVRPPHVLRQALDLVKRRWLQEADYKHACEQLKSIRQDLTVQHLRGELPVAVYEAHARIALEAGDLAEYHQCQSALHELHQEGPVAPENVVEFLAYNILYTAAVSPRSLAANLCELPQAACQHEYVQHALRVCIAARNCDLPALLALFIDAPRMSPYLMDHLLERCRARGLAALSAAFAPSIPLAAVALQLGFASIEEAGHYLDRQDAAVDWEQGLLYTRPQRRPQLQTR